MSNKGFTLIELVLVISIIGILAIIAYPKFYDLTDKAQQASEDGVSAAVRSGINNAYMNNLASGNNAFPTSLGTALNGNCTPLNPCFDGVLDVGITENWSKVGNIYTGPTGHPYTFDNALGLFQ